LVIRKTKKKNRVEIKYSFTNADMAQYIGKAIAYMQAQRFFIEHCIRECKQVLGLSQFQTHKWLAWDHQVALNIMTMCFMRKRNCIVLLKYPCSLRETLKTGYVFFVQKTIRRGNPPIDP
jgi:hypothetical protein